MKRTYRLFALLMAVLMLFGMLPASYAEGGNQMPGGEFTVGCNHNWDWRYPNGEPKHCQDERLMEMYCTLCGQVASSYPVTGDHTHGSWQWDYTPPANCCEWGIQNEFCSVCGEVFNEREVQGEHQWGGYTTIEPAGCETPGIESKLCTVCGEHGDSREIPALGHDWGEWKWEFETFCDQEGLRVRYCMRCNMREEDYVQGGTHRFGEWVITVQPTCMEYGREEQQCSICGLTQWQRVAMIDHVFGEWRVVEEPQVGLPGYERRFCIYQCGTYEEREIPPLEEIAMPELYLNFGLSNTPANNEYYVPGEQIVFEVQYSNPSPQDLVMGHIFAHIKDSPVHDGGVEFATITVLDAVDVPAGKFEFLYITYTVTEEDAARGVVFANANFQANMPNGEPVPEVVADFVSAPCGEDSLNTDGLSLSLSLSSTPANGTHFVVGEEVTFTETWANNTDQTLYPFSVSIFTCAAPVYGSEVDQICSWFAEDYGGPVAPGASGSHTLTVTVTEADVARGAIYAMAELLSTVQDGPDLENVATPYVTAPCAPIVESEAKITKYVSVIPANGEYFVPGETIEYAVIFTNLCPHDLHDVEVYDPLKGENEDITISREPVVEREGTLHLSFSYTVTEEDAARGTVVNTASAIWLNPETEEWSSCDSNTVTTLCGKPADDAADGLTIIWTYTNAPANGSFFVPGEVVDYMATITNTGSVPLNALSVGADVTMAQIPSVSTIAPGQTIICRYNDLLEESDVQSGSMTSKAYVTGYTTGEPTMEGAVDAVSAPVTVPVGKGDITPAVYYHKTVINAPANGSFFTEGETIEYKLSLINNGKKDIYSITLKDPMANTRSVAYARKLVAGDVLQGTFTYVVTAADVANGQVSNTATSTWEAKANGTLTTTPSNTVITPCGSDNSDSFGLVDGLTVTKSVTSTPANGAYYVPGEDIHFLITVNNDTGKELDVIVLTDPLSASFYHEIEAVPAGESVSRSLIYTVTEFDAEIGNVTNYAYAVAYVDDQPMSLTSNSVTALIGFPDTDGDGEPDKPYGIHTWLDVTKEVESLPMNGQFYVEGETVAYKITYTNAGESVLMDVRIYDALVGMAEVATAEYMEPGDSRVCYLNYTVTAEDAQRGDITNTAIGQYVMHGYVNTFYSNEVTVQTNYFKNVIITPDVTEDPGTIDPGKLPLGESSCVRTITGKDNASASYETTFCADHVATQSSVMLMTQAATTPEAQAQAATYAATLWRTEAEKLYQQLLDAADNQGKITVMTEYIRFAAMVTNYEIALKNICPDQPALVAQLIAKLWEDKCVTLCYEIHTAADARTDSLLSVTATSGAAADCACTVTAETAGAKAYTQSFCAAHAFPFSMIDMLLQGQDTADSWATVRQIWMVELNGTYHKVNTLLAGNSDLALAEFNATMQWLEAREAYLNALYPDNPELVAQAMVKHIMDRVNDLCPALK